jgi:hypothetical protein
MTRLFALVLDPTLILKAQGLVPDPWQKDLLFSRAPHLLLNCSRQSGKSTTVAALALHQIIACPGSLVLLVAPSERQSGELFRKVVAAYHAVGRCVPIRRLNQRTLELEGGSRLVALPGREDTIRSFSAVRLLLLDEAARVPDDLYRAVRPMLAVSQGRLVALSTPFGQRGWFYEEWTGAGPWQRIHVPWRECPRISPDFIAEESRALGPTWVDQEYNALFTTMEGLVYPDFASCLVNEGREVSGEGRETRDEGRENCMPHPPSPLAPLPAPLVGGIDFGWRNPFAAVWGHVDQDNVLWITGERYKRETPIADHAAALPKKVLWYVDPAGATEIAELRRHNHIVRRGDNEIAAGIALVTQRIRTGKLKVLAAACPNLVMESRLYRYPTPKERQSLGENPIDAHNHALAALRYLVSRLPKPALPRTDESPKPPPDQATRRDPDDDRFFPEAA